jgi:hypothetical protein
MISSVDHYDALDEILQYLVGRIGESITYRQIKKDVFPKIGIDTFLALANQILDTETTPPYIEGRKYNGYGDWPNEGEIKATSVTEAFLKQGGFRKYYSDQEKKNADEALVKKLDIQLKQKSLIKLKYDKIAFWIATVAAVCSLSFGFLTLYEKGRINDSIEKLEKRFDKQEMEIQTQKVASEKPDTIINKK